MKVAIVSDSHFSEKSRFEECIRIHDWITEACRDHRVELTLHAGDLFDSKSTPKERDAVANWLKRQAMLGPVIIARGNHDVLGDLKLFERLETDHSVIVEEKANIHTINHEIEVVAVSWPRKASMLASGVTDAHQAIQSLIMGLVAQGAPGIPKVLLMHAMVQGSVTSTGQPLVGCDMEISFEDMCATEFALVAMGHIHKSQSWKVDKGDKSTDVVYIGSPRRTNFGETEDKGFLIFDTDSKKKSCWIQTPAAPMLHIDAEWKDGELLIEPADKAHDWQSFDKGEFRLRYTVPSDQRGAAGQAAKQMAETLKSNRSLCAVKIEEVVKPTTRARMPEMAQVKSLQDKLKMFWEYGETLDENRQRRLLDLAAQLEEEVR